MGAAAAFCFSLLKTSFNLRWGLPAPPEMSAVSLILERLEEKKRMKLRKKEREKRRKGEGDGRGFISFFVLQMRVPVSESSD
jgi:hypothetical protein